MKATNFVHQLHSNIYYIHIYLRNDTVLRLKYIIIQQYICIYYVDTYKYQIFLLYLHITRSEKATVRSPERHDTMKRRYGAMRTGNDSGANFTTSTGRPLDLPGLWNIDGSPPTTSYTGPRVTKSYRRSELGLAYSDSHSSNLVELCLKLAD